MIDKLIKVCSSDKFQKIENYIFISILMVFPLLLIRYGIDYTDTGYSITNFQTFGLTTGKIQIATFLANALGAFLMMLPMGRTYVGIVVYTSLFIGVLAIVCYLLLKKYFMQELVFLGVFMALCARWCPGVVLYNYLSYFLYALAVVLLVLGFEKNKKIYCFAAGAMLGLNVFARFPNITHCILILPIIFYCILEKKKVSEIFKIIAVCVGGWLVAVSIMWLIIECMYGPGAYADMVRGLFADAGNGGTYSPIAMLTDNFVEFWEYRKWIIYLTFYIFAGVLFYKICIKKWMKVVFVSIYTLGFALLMKYFHYWSVFTIKEYDNYLAVSFWIILFMISGWILAMKGCFTKGLSNEHRLICGIILCTLLLGPVGSNTGILASFNNMYLVFPFVLGILKEELFGNNSEFKIKRFTLSKRPIQVAVGLVTAITVLQLGLFSIIYIYGELGLNKDMNTRIQGNRILQGVQVSSGNAILIEEISAYIYENGLVGRESITYGNIPFMSFALEMPPALSTSWPDLETYTYDEMSTDLLAVDKPVIIINKYYSFSVFDEEVQKAAPKTKLLADYINSNNYIITFENEKFAVYMSKNEE